MSMFVILAIHVHAQTWTFLALFTGGAEVKFDLLTEGSSETRPSNDTTSKYLFIWVLMLL